MKIISAYLILFVFVSCTQKPENLVIATAANMQFAIPELVRQFEANTDIKCSLIIGSSGKLTAQIKEGAPFDILLSADEHYPTYLVDLNLTADSPSVYAYGQLLMLSNTNIDLHELSTVDVDRIAIANPITAPYGVAAKQVLESLGLWQSLQPKLVFGESIAQTNQFIFTGAADIGITSRSILQAPTTYEAIKYVPIDTSLHKPIVQSMVILNRRSDQIPKAEAFKQFLFSENGQAILLKHGYLANR